jgi:hypothetical protein
VAVWPALIIEEAAQLPPAGQFAPVAAARAKSVPVPVSETLCELLATLSVMARAAFRGPVAVGLKLTLMAQFDPATSVVGLVGHVLVWTKSPLFAPDTAMPVIVSAALPVLVKVTLCAALVVPTSWPLNVRLVAEKPTAGAAAVVPVPVSDMLCGLPAASSVTRRVAFRVPVAVGSNATLITQFAPAASVVGLTGQVLVGAKSTLFAPLIAMLVIKSPALPVLVKVTLCGALVVPTVCPP